MKTISRIAYSNDKKNKTRSILIMMSICLTTMLLVIISTCLLYTSGTFSSTDGKNVEPSIRDGGCRRRVKDVYCKNAGTGRTSL